LKTPLDGELDSIDWFGADAQTVFVVTEEYTLYRSINEGQVFTNELSKMANGTKKFYPYYANGVRAVYPTTDPNKVRLSLLAMLFLLISKPNLDLDIRFRACLVDNSGWRKHL